MNQPQWVTALATITLACSGNPTPEVDGTRLVRIAVASRCPTVGMSYRQAVKAWGKPDSVQIVEDDSLAFFEGAGRTVLALRLERDTVINWKVYGLIDQRIAHEQPDWSIVQGQGFPRRVAEYIRARDLAPERQYALWRSCPQPGMLEEDLVSSWGKPQERQILADGPPEMALLYGFGVEGQHDRFLFRNDSLVDLRYVGWPE